MSHQASMIFGANGANGAKRSWLKTCRPFRFHIFDPWMWRDLAVGKWLMVDEFTPWPRDLTKPIFSGKTAW
jgi:hypothetical protein